jgi:hypothetical protein
MKKPLALLLCLCVLVPSVQAAPTMIGYLENQNNGRIELYSTPTPEKVSRGEAVCRATFVAKTWGDGTEDSYGCWTIVADTVVVHWLTPKGFVERTYLLNRFKKAQR